MIHCPGVKFALTIPDPFVSSDKIVLWKEICTKSIENVEMLPSKRFESHSQSASGLKRPFGVKNDKYGPCHGADFYKNDTMSRSRNPENDTLFSGTFPYGKIYEYPPPPPPGVLTMNTIKTKSNECIVSLKCNEIIKLMIKY